MTEKRKISLGGLPALVLSMTVFGTVGIFRRYIPLPSGWIAMARGAIGMLFLMAVMLIGRKRPAFAVLRKNLIPLLISGACIGVNWILFFESYLYTTVATATVCYYMAPVIVTLLSPLVLRERLTVKKAICVAVAFVGAALVSGIGQTGGGASQYKGILLALGAAVLYACVVLMNKKMQEVPALDRTATQLGAAALVLVPYALIAEPVSTMEFTPFAVICLAVVGVLHTGVAYALYFGSIGKLGAQTAALCSYIDPVVAIVLAAIIFNEPFTVASAIGTVLVIGAALAGELELRRKPKHKKETTNEQAQGD